MCSISGQHNLDGCGEEPCLKAIRKDDNISSRKRSSKLSTSAPIAKNITSNFRCLYKTEKRSIFAAQPSNSSKPSSGCRSAVSSEAPSAATGELLVSASDAPVKCNDMAMPSSNGHLNHKESDSKHVLTKGRRRISNTYSADNGCSSSKSSFEFDSTSLKPVTVNGGDSFASGPSIAIEERGAFISILRNHGCLGKGLNRPQHRDSGEGTRANGDSCYCSMRCKVCEGMESTSKMLICDSCEDAVHVSCYNPNMMILPKGEWLCRSCLKKKHKVLTDKSSGGSGGEFGSLEFLLRDTEPYMSNVRIGDEFQANVPDWRSPIIEECDLCGDPSEMNHNDGDQKDPIKPLKLSSIGNWVQCRAIIDGISEDIDGTVCGKWRRVPLFEVQTDDWECYRCILWDPTRADCAVPQEVKTEEVMRQLKYIEMLRPRLTAKSRKIAGSFKG
ncbi:uncharacterized protein LOC127242408 [Andrographis paniculata]|uniref:uncharacterized protein LOC127242408 n=1 Tax=Andrographis paniculata TaxID=175694 RepID=UPI0021E7B743|nr:uncharacterized protein LOC127242408 [Andrographis paniculata]XP_051117905.1 uncharacterized protein LOC127242408 [Andrographis paniculata]